MSKFERQNAMRDWQAVKSDADVVMWHQLYTPWWPVKEVVETLLPIYAKRREEGNSEDLIVLSEFDKLRLKSI
jgi:hypothetical protein